MSADPTPPAASRDGDLAVARRVLGIEAAALTALGAALDASFDLYGYLLATPEVPRD